MGDLEHTKGALIDRLMRENADLLAALERMVNGTGHHPACHSRKGPTCDCAHAEARTAIARARIRELQRVVGPQCSIGRLRADVPGDVGA